MVVIMQKGMRFAVLLLMACMLAGCGCTNEETENGMQLLEKLDYRGALAAFEKEEASEERPVSRADMRLIERGRGIAYMGLTEYEQAISCFQEALAGSNGIVEDVDFDLNYYLAAAYTKNGQDKEAESTYNAILSLRPEEEDAYFLRGSARLKLSDYEGAKADFDKVAEMDAKNYGRLIDIYRTFEHFGYKEVGQAYLQNALNQKDNQIKQFDKGRIYYYLGDYQKASLALEEAREKGGAESYLYLGKSYEATGDYNYAASVYNSYLSKDTSNAEIYNQLGLCELAKKDYRKALEAFQAGIKIEGNTHLQTLSFNEIVAYEYLEEYQKAAVLLDTYLKTYPDDETAKREKEFLSTR